jgi:hypothetical protein
MLDEGGKNVCSLAILLFIAGFAVQALGLATSFLEGEVAHGYYNQHFDYRLGYNALGTQAELLLKYLGNTDTVPIGLGFDRWFIFLAKGGVSDGTLLAATAVILCGALLSIAALARRQWNEGTSPARMEKSAASVR